MRKSSRASTFPALVVREDGLWRQLPLRQAGSMMLSRYWFWLVVMLVWLAVAVAEKQDLREGTFDAATNPIIQQLESSLLSSFGLKRRPGAKKDLVAPPYMLELFYRQQGTGDHNIAKDEQEDYRPMTNSDSYNTARSFTHEERETDNRYPSHKMRLRFNLANLPGEEELHSAELRLTHLRHPAAPDHVPEDLNTNLHGRKHRRRRSKAAPYLNRILVYDVVRGATRLTEPALRLLDTEIVDVREMGVHSMDVSDAVRRWTVTPKNNNGLLVEIVPFSKSSPYDGSHVQLKRLGKSRDAWLQDQPLLVVYSNDPEAKKRKKRSAANKYKKIRDTCQRHRLHVDFRQVGWDDWITAPIGYDAYFCKGECQFPLHDSLNYTNHAVIQTLVNSAYPDRVPRPCCVPTELSPISMLYVDDDKNFVLKNHQNMVVEGCGCR